MHGPTLNAWSLCSVQGFLGPSHHYPWPMSATPGVAVTLFRALALTTRQLNAAVEQRLQRTAGVSLPEFEILHALQESPERRARPGELGAMLAWEKSRTSHQVTRMERRGLLTRGDCDADMRGTWIELTDVGARAVEAAIPAFHEAVRHHLGAVAATPEGETLARLVLSVGKEVSPGECNGAVVSLERSLDG